MKKHTISFFLLFCLAFSAYGQEMRFRDFNPILKQFLLGYCDEGERQPTPDKIRALGAQIEPEVLFVIQNGVPDELLKNLRRSLRKQFRQRQKWLASGRTFGLSNEDLQAAKAETLDQFVKQQVTSYSDGFMSQAYFALGLINTPQGNKILQITANNKQSPYSNDARNALKFKDKN